MKTQLQVAMAALILGMSSAGFVYAGEDDDVARWGEKPSFPDYNIPDRDDCSDCTGKFKVKVHVPQTCKIEVKKHVVMLKAGGTAENYFTVTTNGKYNLLVDADGQVGMTNKSLAKGNHGGTIGLHYTTTSGYGMGAKSFDLGKTYHDQPSYQSKYKVLIKADEADHHDKGIFDDEYNITVSF